MAGYYYIALYLFVQLCLSVCRRSVYTSIFSFLDDNLSKFLQIFTKLNVCIDIVEIWFEIVNWQISSIFDRVISPRQVRIFHFYMITLVNINGFSSNVVCALILWRSGLGLHMSKFRQFFGRVICPRHVSIFILDNNFSKYQLILTKLNMCIYIVDVWFGIANGQISSGFYRVICPGHVHIFISGQ